MKLPRVSTAIALSLLVSCTSVEPQQPPGSPSVAPSPSPSERAAHAVYDLRSLVAGLRAAGYEVTVRGPMRAFRPIFDVAPTRLKLAGEEMWAVEYATPRALAKVRSSVSAHGDMVGGAIIQWTAPPQFYSSGTLLVMYFGHRQSTRHTFTDLLGTAFAGE